MEISEIFNRMDNWRHLPNWQLERRADIFFSMYLKRVIQDKFNKPLKDVIIPEFPLLAIPKKNQKQSNRTNKVDYALFSDDGKACYLVELKTDIKSIGKEQPEYLEKAKDKDLKTLSNDLLAVFRATNDKKKYINLFNLMRQVGLVEFKSQVSNSLNVGKYDSVSLLINDIKILENTIKPTIVYIQPLLDKNPKDSNKHESFVTIDFMGFAKALEGCNDPLTLRFHASLKNWAKVVAGNSDYVKLVLGDN
jgi:hypothetical protein